MTTVSKPVKDYDKSYCFKDSNELEINNFQGEELTDILPSSLIKVTIINCPNLRRIKEIFFDCNHLTHLTISFTKLEKLPEKLPSNLQYIDVFCHEENEVELPTNLPSSLKRLYIGCPDQQSLYCGHQPYICSYDYHTELFHKNRDNGLLYIHNNKFTKLPEKLHSIKVIMLTHSNVKKLEIQSSSLIGLYVCFCHELEKISFASNTPLQNIDISLCNNLKAICHIPKNVLSFKCFNNKNLLRITEIHDLHDYKQKQDHKPEIIIMYNGLLSCVPKSIYERFFSHFIDHSHPIYTNRSSQESSYLLFRRRLQKKVNRMRRRQVSKLLFEHTVLNKDLCEAITKIAYPT